MKLTVRNKKWAAVVIVCMFALASMLGALLVRSYYAYPETPHNELAIKMSALEHDHGQTIIIFHKTGCHACNQVANPIKQRLKTEKHAKVIVIDTAKYDNRKYVSQFGIRVVPTILKVSHGQEIARYSGTSMTQINHILKEE
ncbi:thioredoxin domain-containing protein [Weissella viridescens]|uniref:thioredoxin domain-containing protein n=1 Tax=Weissella viridescens TaxID=1629 RepID=UPI003AF2331B